MTNLTSSEWAAWTQGVGSVLAIVAAIMIAAHQHRVAERRLVEAEQRRRDQTSRQCVAFAVELVGCVAEVLRGCEFENVGMVQRQEVRLRDLLEFARSIRLADVPVDAVFALLRLRGIAVEAGADVDMVIVNWGNPTAGNKEDLFRRWVERANAANVDLHKALGNVLEEATAEAATTPGAGLT